MEPESTPKRGRGGQPGNTNALKHGYYAEKLPPTDRDDLENHPFSGVAEEAEILRVFIRRVVELSAGANNLPLDQAVRLLRILALSVTSLSHILRTDQILFRHQITDHDRAYQRRRQIRLALEDAQADADLAAQLAARAQSAENDPLPVLPEPADIPIMDEAARDYPTFDQAIADLARQMAALDTRFPELAGDDPDQDEPPGQMPFVPNRFSNE